MARPPIHRLHPLILAATLGLGCGGAFAQESLTVVSWGGAYGEAQKKHVIEPYQKDTGVRVLFEDYTGGVAEIKAQVESGRIQWDVVDFEVIDLERACSEGLLEEIPRDILPPGVDGTPAEEDFIPEALASECAIGNIVWSVVFAYNERTIGGTKAATIEDFFDTQKIPGKRALRKRPQVNMEWALMADGVAPEEVYEVLATPEGQQRAFDKLDTIRGDLVWFDSWSQAPQLLNDGGAVLVQSANGRFYDSIRQENKPFVIVWDGHVRPGCLGHRQGLAEEGAGAEVHCLCHRLQAPGRHAGHRLRPDPQVVHAAGRPDRRAAPAHRASGPGHSGRLGVLGGLRRVPRREIQ